MSELPFRIKICGVTNAGDALAAVRAGADAIGLNFYPRSKRFVSRDQIESIVRNVPREIVKVGVFVNPTLAEVHAVLNSGMIDFGQLHGDEPPELLAGARRSDESHPLGSGNYSKNVGCLFGKMLATGMFADCTVDRLPCRG